MAYKSKFLHFKTKASYEAERAKTTEGSENRKIFDAYISFIDEGPTICTWGKEYQCDTNSLSTLAQELTTEQQEQVFANLGWKVHSISQSDINGSSPSTEEKTKRLEASALLVKETGLIYIKGTSTGLYVQFYKTLSKSQVAVLLVEVATGKITNAIQNFTDDNAVQYTREQSLSDTQKQQARTNIGAISQAEVEALDLGLTEKDLTSIDSDRVKLVSSGTVDKSFPYPELILSDNDIPDIKTSKTFNTSLLGDKLISTIGGKEVVSSKILLVINYSGSSSQIFLYRVENAIEVTEGVDYTLYYQGLDSQYVLAISFPNMVLGSTMTLYYNDISIPLPSSNPPKSNGTATPGTSLAYSRGDHVHPIQESVAKLTIPRTIALTGAVSGSATFDGSSNVSINSTLNGFDASKITSGTLNADRLPEIPISKIPAAAMERLYVVESQSAAMSLTIQEGDVVQIGSGGPMYFCVSESASTFATKFKVFTAGAATSVPWSGVTGAPTLSLRSLQVNAVGYQVYSNVATSIPMIYAPTEIGTSGQILQSTGNGAPKWVNQSSLSFLPLSGGNLTGDLRIISNFTVDGETELNNNLWLGGDFVPSDSNQYSIGLELYKFKAAYINETYSTNFYMGDSKELVATQSWVTGRGYLTSIPVATSSTYGGIQIGYTTSGKNYAVQLSHGKAYVNVPWTDTNTNYYPTTFTWANGTTAGPTGSLTGSEMSAVSFGAIPSASATQSGVVTTGDQTFGGIKTIDTINVTNINEATPGEGFWIGYNTEGVIRIGKDGDYDFGTSGGTYSGTANTAKRLLNSLQFSNGQSFNGSSAVTIDLPEIPVALPNPYALTINGQSYTGSSAVSISTSKPLSVRILTSSTVYAGYSYSCGTSKAISTLNGFSSTNPDSVIISSAKLTFTASNVIKMDGLDDLSGTWYIYCLSYMANSKIAVNGAVYA